MSNFPVFACLGCALFFKMPIEGFPKVLEGMLNSALQELTLSSFKVEGRGNQTVVVLRFASKITDHTPVTPVQNATYRRKCPAQMNRDRTRAEMYRANQRIKSCEEIQSPSGLFLPTPPSLFYDADNTKNNVAVDMSVCDTQFSPLSSSCQNNQGIDIVKYNGDRQTVTLSFNDIVSDHINSEDVNEMNECDFDDVSVVKRYACDGVNEMEDDDCNDVNEMKGKDCEIGDECEESGMTEAMCKDCIEQVTESSEHQETAITTRDVMDCIEKLAQKMDDCQSIMKDFNRCNSGKSGDVQGGNLHRDVS